MTLLPPGVKVHLALGYIDMRKGIDIMHDAQPAHAFEQFLPFELVQCARHDADSNAAIDRAHQPFFTMSW
jgi:hypothetical protein